MGRELGKAGDWRLETGVLDPRPLYFITPPKITKDCIYLSFVMHTNDKRAKISFQTFSNTQLLECNGTHHLFAARRACISFLATFLPAVSPPTALPLTSWLRTTVKNWPTFTIVDVPGWSTLGAAKNSQSA